MLFADHLIVLRGGGDLATGIAFRLHRSGFPLVILELPRPLVVRRRVSLATAILEERVDVEGLQGIRVDKINAALTIATTGMIPVIPRPDWPGLALPARVLVDARMVKRNIDTTRDQAPLVVALGPGFEAGRDCHAVIETMRGHTLGRVIWEGAALPDTGTPGIIGGRGAERVIRSPEEGLVSWAVAIGDRVENGQLLGRVGQTPILAPFAGVLRGLIAPGTKVPQRLKIGDLDARADRSACFTISDKALAIGGGVLEAVLTDLNGRQRGSSGR